MILSFGGEVLSNAEDNFESEEYQQQRITHVLTDREPKFLDVREDR